MTAKTTPGKSLIGASRALAGLLPRRRPNVCGLSSANTRSSAAPAQAQTEGEGRSVHSRSRMSLRSSGLLLKSISQQATFGVRHCVRERSDPRTNMENGLLGRSGSSQRRREQPARDRYRWGIVVINPWGITAWSHRSTSQVARPPSVLRECRLIA
jgi:hypothetical protein